MLHRCRRLRLCRRGFRARATLKFRSGIFLPHERLNEHVKTRTTRSAFERYFSEAGSFYLSHCRAALEFRFRHPILRDSSMRCHPRYAQRRGPDNEHFYHMRSPYFRFRLRVVNACVFLKCALGRPERYQKQRLCLALIADENSFCLPVSAETVVREVD